MRVHLRSSLALIAAAGSLACADGTGPAAGRPLSVSFTTVNGTGAGLSRSLDASSPRLATGGTDVLLISSAKVVVARMELERVDAACTSEEAAGDDDRQHENDDCEELQLGPTIVNLPVDANSTVVSAVDVNIPEGSYSSLEAKVRPIRSNNGRGKGSAAFLAAHPEFDGVDVRVEGTFNGTPFVYKGAVSANVERHFDPPLTVGAAPVNLTVQVDLANWFRSRSGTLIDPSTANASGPNAELVAQNIRRSFHAFRDNDRNGHDDDGERHP